MKLKATRTITSTEDKTAKFLDGGEHVEFSPEQIVKNVGVLSKDRDRTAVNLYFSNAKYKQIAEEIDLSQQYTKKILRRSITKICESIHAGEEAPKAEKGTKKDKKNKPDYQAKGIGIQPTEHCKACGKPIENGDPHLCEACRYELDNSSTYIACPSCGKQRHKIQLDYHNWKCPNCNTPIPKDKRPIKTEKTSE